MLSGPIVYKALIDDRTQHTVRNRLIDSHIINKYSIVVNVVNVGRDLNNR